MKVLSIYKRPHDPPALVILMNTYKPISAVISLKTPNTWNINESNELLEQYTDVVGRQVHAQITKGHTVRAALPKPQDG